MTTTTLTRTITLAGPVDSKITFFQDPADGATPYNFVYDPPAGVPQRNYEEETLPVTINDIRNSAESISLDTNGFAVHSNVASSMKYNDWDSDDTIKAKYYPEVEQTLLSKIPGANKIIFFDHTIRRTRPDSKREPVTRAHIDQTAKSARERVVLHADSEEEANKLLNGRYRLVNVWRPIQTTPIRAFPLAMADSRTVEDADLVPVEHRYPERTGETAGVRYNKGQKWYYFSEMEGTDRIFLQCFDSEGSHARVAHTAFADPRSPQGEGRESIEVRALVFN
jgi:hypothetical protein